MKVKVMKVKALLKFTKEKTKNRFLKIGHSKLESEEEQYMAEYIENEKILKFTESKSSPLIEINFDQTE